MNENICRMGCHKGIWTPLPAPALLPPNYCEFQQEVLSRDWLNISWYLYVWVGCSSLPNPKSEFFLEQGTTAHYHNVGHDDSRWKSVEFIHSSSEHLFFLYFLQPTPVHLLFQNTFPALQRYHLNFLPIHLRIIFSFSMDFSSFPLCPCIPLQMP